MSARGTKVVWVRLLVTAVAVGVSWAAQRLILPGLEGWKLERFMAADLASLSVVALGLSPAISGFVLVELAALTIPPWRPLRTGGPDGRAALRRAALVTTVVLAAIQGWFIVRWLEGDHEGFGSVLAERGTGPALVITLTLVGGTCFLLALAWLIDRYGLGNGFSVLLASAALPALAQRIAHSAEVDLLDSAVVITSLAKLALIVVPTVWVLTAHRKQRSLLRHPTSGLVPLSMAAWIVGLPQLSMAMGFTLGERLVPYAGGAGVVLAALLCVGFSVLFNWPARLAKVLGPDVDVKALLREATLRTLPYVVGVAAVSAWLLARRPLFVDVGVAIMLTAVTIDLVTEWRARQQHDELVPAWPLHQVALLGAALEALARAEIPAYARGAHHRALLHFFGPHIAIDLLVPPARVADAQRVLTALLGTAEITAPAAVPARQA